MTKKIVHLADSTKNLDEQLINLVVNWKIEVLKCQTSHIQTVGGNRCSFKMDRNSNRNVKYV
jgi:hypothetical protein